MKDKRLLQKLGKSGEGHIWLLFTLFWGQIFRVYLGILAKVGISLILIKHTK
jgi:hypothetical protein